MTLVATEGGGADFEPFPEGSYAARCVQVIDLGTQPDDRFGPKHKIMLGWETPEVPNGDDKPRLTWQEYTLSLNENANLRIALESWRGKEFTAVELEGFALTKLLGAPCIITVKHSTSGKGRTYAKVIAVVKLPKGMEVAKAAHDYLTFDIDEFDQTVFDTFADFLKGKIMQSHEMVARNGGEAAVGAPSGEQHQPISEDDIPF